MNAIYGNRYVEVHAENPIAAAQATYELLLSVGNPNAERWAAANICQNCGHPLDSHLDETDKGWCTRPAGSCIFNPCHCTTPIRK